MMFFQIVKNKVDVYLHLGTSTGENLSYKSMFRSTVPTAQLFPMRWSHSAAVPVLSGAPRVDIGPG